LCACSSETAWCLRDTGCCNSCKEQKGKFDRGEIAKIDPDCLFCDWLTTGGRCKKRRDFCAHQDDFCISEGTCCEGMYCAGLAETEGLLGGGICEPKKDNGSHCFFSDQCKSESCEWFPSASDKGLFTCQDPICRTRIEKCGGYCSVPGFTDELRHVRPGCTVDECDPDGGACSANWTSSCMYSCASLTGEHAVSVVTDAAWTFLKKQLCGVARNAVLKYVADKLVSTVLNKGVKVPGFDPTCHGFVDMLGGYEWRVWCLAQPLVQSAATALGTGCEAAFSVIPGVGTVVGGFVCPIASEAAADRMCNIFTLPLVKMCEEFIVDKSRELLVLLGEGHVEDVAQETADWLYKEMGCT
jgi:hypothetical protein